VSSLIDKVTISSFSVVMKYTILSGSQRTQAQSLKVAKVIQNIVETEMKSEGYLLDLAHHPLPLYDDEFDQGAPEAKKFWHPFGQHLKESDAVIVVSPEWNGMVPPAVKNFFLLTSKDEIGHKPSLIVTVSSTRGGAYPVAELRMSSYKNTRLCYIPEHVIVRDAKSVFNAVHPDSNNSDDVYLHGRLRYALKLLEQYAKALSHVRGSGVIDHVTYANGM
jgi:NAD(P)H-dependent FMN reductase